MEDSSDLEYSQDPIQQPVYPSLEENQSPPPPPPPSPPPLPFWQKLAYGVGHVLNDLTASMCFSYLLIYFHVVLSFENLYAGYLMLIGQIADAIATTFVGIQSDKNDGCLYLPKRRSWHLVGTVCILFTFPFIFNLCILCSNEPTYRQFWYYTIFFVIFQCGWASVQISHLSLIPELTKDKHERVELNSIRYAFTVLSNLMVCGIFWLLFNFETDNDGTLGPDDALEFRVLVFIVCGIGLFFTIIFHLGTKEKTTSQRLIEEPEISKESLKENFIRMTWKDWWFEIQFYMIFILYMSTRLFVNISQMYFPLYLIETIKLSKGYIALVPLIVNISGFITSVLLRYVNKLIGAKMTCFLGLLFCLSFSIWTWCVPEHSLQVFATATLNGIGGTTILVTSLALSAELIADNTECSAFVFGALSFFDKIANGVFVVIIQDLHPCNGCCPKCAKYERFILSAVPCFFALLALFMLGLLAPQKIGKRSGQRLLQRISGTPPTTPVRSCW